LIQKTNTSGIALAIRKPNQSVKLNNASDSNTSHIESTAKNIANAELNLQK